MDQGEYLHVIGVGAAADWEAGRGSLYYIEDKSGEKAMPTFTSAARAESYIKANLSGVEAHMQMLEGIGVTHAPPLTEGRFVILPLDAEGVAWAALMVEADYLIRDPRPGYQQETIRVPK